MRWLAPRIEPFPKMNDTVLDRVIHACHGSPMKFLSRIATRWMLVCGLALTAGTAGAAPPGQGADSGDVPPREKARPHRSGEERAQGKRPAKPEAHKPGDKGKPPPAKADAAPVPGLAVPPVPKPPVVSGEPPLKLPRFAALKTDETNMRRGPGQRYPIDWVYKRRDLPVEVEREYDVWRLVRDPEGVQGWVHQVTLSERRTFVVAGADATIRSGASDTAVAVALLKPGVIGRLRACDQGSKWCQVQVGTFKGYLRRDQVWGLLPDEVVTPS